MSWLRAASTTSPRAASTLLTGMFVLATVLSAFLLFSVQLLFGKLLLPAFGGGPSVWNTCMVFFQVALLAGYGYAHALASRCRLHTQLALHLGLLALVLTQMPLGLPAGWQPAPAPMPAAQLLRVLAFAVAVPFIAVSASAPLLQHWFAQTAHPAARSPYFLYAASNAGSFAALLGYPFLIEPSWTLTVQRHAWAVGLALLAGCFACCAWLTMRFRAAPEGAAYSSPAPAAGAPTWNDRARWLALAALPASLLLGVTTYLSTDVASVPLLWVGPLALYLLTFVLVFADRPPLKHEWMLRCWPPFVALTVLALIVGYNRRPAALAVVHLLTFFLSCMVCHGELNRRKPSAAHLTQFYLLLACGGALGGLFNALLAPALFRWPQEYPLALIGVALLLPGSPGARARPADRWLDLAFPATLAVLCIALSRIADAAALPNPWMALLIRWGIPLLFCLSFRRRPLRFMLGLVACLAVGAVTIEWKNVIGLERSFFGVYRVLTAGAQDDPAHLLKHGTTLHGIQRLAAARRREPLSYFSRSSPIGEAFADLAPRLEGASIAVVGLGTGTLAAYGRAGQRWTFFEIDPTVERLARDPRYFTFLADTPAEVRVVIGDARQSLGRLADHAFSLFILDAFSSDAIPLHLLTREATELYQRKMAEGGVVAFHISNRHLQLRHVLGDIAHATGWAAIARVDEPTDAAIAQGISISSWVLLARRAEDLELITREGAWSVVEPRARGRVWTDDYSDILSVVKWR